MLEPKHSNRFTHKYKDKQIKTDMPEQKETQEFHVIIAAAGSGRRFKSDIPKQYHKIYGKTVLRHTLDNILNWPGLRSLRVIIDPKYADLYQDSVKGLDLPEASHGGKERNKSINNALRNISHVKGEDIILIHDAVRPLAKWADVKRLLETLTTCRAATLAHPVSDTLRQVKNKDASEIVNRSNLWALQTPQGFHFDDLKKAHAQRLENIEYTDDTSLVSAIGIPVKIVEGSRTNIKITTQSDIVMAQALLSNTLEIRTGLGFDVHAFDDGNSNKPLKLCGVEIEDTSPLKGHSDADVALHAVTDALLGALGEDDIGKHFPPSDPKFKDMDSSTFVEKAMDMLQNKNGKILNVDLTLICEAPKVGPCRDRMKERLSEIIGIDPARINIKATTTEKLGFTGRGEGIVAQAITTIQLPAE